MVARRFEHVARSRVLARQSVLVGICRGVELCSGREILQLTLAIGLMNAYRHTAIGCGRCPG